MTEKKKNPYYLKCIRHAILYDINIYASCPLCTLFENINEAEIATLVQEKLSISLWLKTGLEYIESLKKHGEENERSIAKKS
jgi:hypothetical protein